MSDWEEMWEEWTREVANKKKSRDGECDCYVPDPVDCSVFRPKWVCDSCGREINIVRMEKKK